MKAAPARPDAPSGLARLPYAGRPGAATAAGLLFASLALFPLLAHMLGDPFLLVIATRVMIFGLAAMSLDLILGYGALVSFGHAAFIGIGAYAVAILAAHGIDELLIQALVAIAASSLFALATGAISLRTRGVYFIMITLAFGQMAYFFMVSLSAYGGDDGISLAARSTLFGSDVLENDLALFYAVFLCLALAFLGLRAVVASRFGRVLRGTRDNRTRMEAIGFAPFAYQLIAYVIAGGLAGLAGVFLANQAEFVAPAFMSWQRSGELIVMVVLGGMGTLVGPIVGSIAFLLLEDWLARFSEHWRLGLGIVLVLLALFTRGGISGLVARLTGGAPR
ncbi:branched-chain amino acid ABC transporter permease [Aurantimonas sp. HBX-1]|uniref:branched-chain amino acid ABC transporter permease n=1 Tax=Aurantimonas sp. HBX-1 TaxID=2906072 RepID=UPI001F354E28|nr:branched-chain amino acid ABC transporter permease [Aurantimonas sp. HBX-1]UIJ73569.1 branched-chain amino acid ABC transporter permease [Aurantimonas sp. HBX-1]